MSGVEGDGDTGMGFQASQGQDIVFAIDSNSLTYIRRTGDSRSWGTIAQTLDLNTGIRPAGASSPKTIMDVPVETIAQWGVDLPTLGQSIDIVDNLELLKLTGIDDEIRAMRVTVNGRQRDIIGYVADGQPQSWFYSPVPINY